MIFKVNENDFTSVNNKITINILKVMVDFDMYKHVY